MDRQVHPPAAGENHRYAYFKFGEAGFPGPIRKKQSKDAEELLYENRTYRRAETYTDYAKDICKNYKSDVRKYNLCVTQKRYIGVSGITDFNILKEDITFLNDCFKTVLKSYAAYFKKRYITLKMSSF